MAAGVSVVLVVGGLALLVFGAEALVRGAASFGKQMGITEIVIGLTIVAFGTSMPEMAVNVLASAEGRNDIVFGNIIGSNLFNVLFILGVSALISPLVVQHNTVWKEIPFSALATLVLLLLVNDTWHGVSNVNLLSVNDGLVLLLLFAIFLAYAMAISKAEPSDAYHVKLYSLPRSLALVAAGLLVLVIGARLCVTGAVSLGRQLNVSEKFIGCAIVAAGTSLPELATSAIAAYRGYNAIAVGNVVGSNIFNVLAILGVGAVIRPVQYQSSFNVDTLLLIGATIVLFVAMFTGGRRRIDRWEGVVLMGVYVGYTAYLLYLR